MDVSNLVIAIPIGAIVIGFVYFTFIFPKKAEKEEEEEKKSNQK
jgi:phosphotransferase system  glucose/maltose/N-acetylglucosamine-specific IIC component